jgi:hypothetical protein
MRRGYAWRAALSRGWWIGALIVVLVAFGAGVRYMQAVRAAPYVATQQVHIALLMPLTASTTDAAAANANAASIARLLASGGLLAASDLDAAIAARMHANAPTLAGVTPEAVAAGLSASQDGATITLRAQWPSAAGADELLKAAVAVLQGGALATAPALAPLVPPGAVLQIDATGTPDQAVPDAGTQMAARGDLLMRFGLGLAVGFLAALAAGWLSMRRMRAVATPRSASPAHE